MQNTCLNDNLAITVNVSGDVMAEIQLRKINKRWGGFVGVDNFDLTIADQEFLVLLDPSGCGKTTTMRMIAGLEDATDGDIVIDGKRVNDLEPKERDVAMVFQCYGFTCTSMSARTSGSR